MASEQNGGWTFDLGWQDAKAERAARSVPYATPEYRQYQEGYEAGARDKMSRR